MTAPANQPVPFRRTGPTGLGQALREARLTRGLTLEDAQRATRIARRYLEALEQEAFDVLPAPVFARGFLRSYAQYLGLDPTTLIAGFPGEPRPPESLPAATMQPDPVITDPRRRPRPSSEGPRHPLAADPQAELSAIPTIDVRTPSVRLGPWLVAAFVSLVVLVGVVVVVTLGDSDAPASGTPLSTAPGVVAGLAEGEVIDPAAEEPLAPLETMPDFLSLGLSQATTTLRRSGQPFVIVQLYDESAPAGAILEQIPAAGTDLKSSSTVTLVVSRGLRPAPQTDQPAAAPQSTAPTSGPAPAPIDSSRTGGNPAGAR